MKFLVVFIALMLKWKLPVSQRSGRSGKFSGWLGWWQKASMFRKLNPLLQYGLVVVLPVAVLSGFFWYSERFAWGLITLVLEILMLVYLLAHAGMQRHLEEYREDLRKGDAQGAYHCAEKYLEVPEAEGADDTVQLNERVIRILMHRWFEYFFLMVFWYMIADVAGLLLAWFTLQYARSSHCDAQGWRYLHWLEWIPVRLLGLTFGLAGNLMRSLPVLKQYLWQWQANSADVLFDVASHALSDNGQKREWHNAAEDAEAAARELDEWQQLHWRCVSVWMVMIAMATIGGWLL